MVAVTGHSHSHGGSAPSIVVAPRARRVLLAVLGAGAVATVVGLVLLWPAHGALDRARSRVQYAAPGVTFPDGSVTAVSVPCAADGAAPTGAPSASACDTFSVRVTDGAGSGTLTRVGVPHDLMSAGVAPGDRVQLSRTPGTSGHRAAYAFVTVRRGVPLAWLTLAFALLVVVVARWRGLFALISLGLGGIAIWLFTLPALLSGESGTAVALVSASAIMYVVLYATHGFSLRTSAALVGTLAGVGVTAALGLLVIDRGHLTGVADETGGFLSTAATSLDFAGLLAAGVIIAGLGVLNDVTITQASAVWELREAAPTMSRRRVFAGAMRIGRDHIASTIYTIVFAYAGTALLTLLLVLAYDRPLLDLISSEDLADEIARTLTSGIGLVLAVPLTTAIAALVAGPVAERPRTDGPGRAGTSDPAGGSDDTGTGGPGEPGGRPPVTTGPGKRRGTAPRRRWRRSPDWDLEPAGPPPARPRRDTVLPPE